MSNIFNYKLHTKDKAVLSVLTVLLLVLSVTLPLIPTASAAAATVSISPTSGPNGTAVKVTGSGFGASESQAAFTITANGISGKVTTTGGGLAAAYNIATNSSGGIVGASASSGYIVIGGAGGLNLAPGTYSIQISDGTASPPAVTFTVTAPTVTLAPSTGVAGTSVLVSATGYPVSVKSGATTIYDASSNVITDALYAGTHITVEAATVTADPTHLSSNAISATGSYTGTVTLPGITTAGSSAFQLIDNLGNTGVGSLSTVTPTISLSPASGVPGTLVTVTASGFAPNVGFTGGSAVVKFDTTTIVSLKPAAPVTTEQGTGVFQFAVPSSGTLAGAHTITVTDANGNTATAAFTITPQVTMYLGDGTTSSMTTSAPTGATAALYMTLAGFAKSAPLTITGSPGVPSAWLTFATMTTSATGDVAAEWSTTTASAPAAGVYSITVSDGTNSVVTLLTIASSGNFFVITPASGATGTAVALIGFGAAPTTAINFDGSAIAGATQCDANAWPTAPTTVGSFVVPSSSAGPHTITTTGIAGSATFTNTGSPSISVVSPSPASGGTTVTIVGSGFANGVVTLPTLTVDGITPATVGTAVFTSGQMIQTFTMPAFLAGAHTIVVADSFSNTATASVSTLVPSVSVSPASGVVGGATALKISVTGSGFPAAQAITVKFDSTTLGAATIGCSETNYNGGILLFTTSITALTAVPAGTHTVTISAGPDSATASFTVLPTINTGATTAVRAGPSTAVVISGNGFTATSALSIFLNGTATTWFNTGTHVNSTTVNSDASGSVPAASAVLIPSSIAAQNLNITVVDASTTAYSAYTILTVLGTPTITLAATQTIAGAGIPSIGIAGTGFTPGAGITAVVNILSDSTTVVAGAQTASPITVSGTGTFANTVEGVQVTSALLTAGTYTVQLKLGTSPNFEIATATLTVLGAPAVTVNPTTANIGGNVSINIFGMQDPTAVKIGATDITAALHTTTVPLTGTNAYNLTTWFLVPTGITGGTYTLTVNDGTRFTTTSFTVGTSITLTPTTSIIKGSTINVAGSGFGPSLAFTVLVNGVAIASAAGTTNPDGTLPATAFTVPITASSTSTVQVNDTNGNTATKTFSLTAPQLMLTPTSGSTGSTVQIIASGFKATSSVIIQMGGIVATTAPASVTTDATGAFIAYATVPSGLSGNVTVTAIDASNNMGTAYFQVGGAGTVTVNTSTMSTTAQTTNSAGQTTTSFTAGSTVKVSFVLQSNSGSGTVICAVTFQQGAQVYNIASTPASISTTGNTVYFTNLLPAGKTGTWTATLQVYASDGVTPLGVTTLTFTVS